MEIVDAEVVEDPCECVCGDCQAGRHCDRASCATAFDVIYDGPMDNTILVQRAVIDAQLQTAYTRVRMVPTGRECWQRLYSTPTSFLRDRQDHGVRAVHPDPHDPHALILDLGGYAQFTVRALAWRVIPRQAPKHRAIGAAAGGDQLPEVHTGDNDGPEAIDLLVDFPPALPGYPRSWQQMTNPGQLQHPGDDRNSWSFNVSYTDGYMPPETKVTTSIGDAALDAMGFKTLGYMKDDRE